MTTIAGTSTGGSVDYRDPEPRLRQLFDQGTPRLLTPADGSGVLTARGEIEGMPAIAYASDGNRIGAAGCGHIVDAIDTAVRERLPVLGLWPAGSARLPEGVLALDGVGSVFAAMVRASGRVPQISVVLGPAAGAAAYGPALTDIVIDIERPGGAESHRRRSGVVHVTAKDDGSALAGARALAGLLGRQGRLSPSDVVEDVDLGALLPAETDRAYDVKPLVRAVLDEPGVELHAKWAPNIVTTLGRFGGRTVGVVANNPLRLGGRLDVPAAEKAARFVRMCDALGVPLIVLVDVPGHLPGVDQEWDAVVRRGAKLLHAFAEAVVPRITLVTRKSYGGAYIAMNSKSLGATAVFAWPGAEIAVVGASAVEQRIQTAGGVSRALEIGVVDEVIKPTETRRRIAAAIAAAPAARGAHGNIPL